MTDAEKPPELVPAPVPLPVRSEVTAGPVEKRSRPSAGEKVGTWVTPAIDKFGPITVYALTGAIGLAAAVTSGVASLILGIVALIVGTLGAAYNKRESSNHAALKAELEVAVKARGTAELGEKQSRRRELEVRKRATVLAIKALMEDLDLTSHDRATLFWVRADQPPRLFIVERVADDPNYQPYESDKFYEANEGFIGTALSDGHAYCADLPDPRDPADAGAYGRAHEAHGLTSRQAAELSMKSRTYFGMAIESATLGQGHVGVLMLESLDPDRWADRVDDLDALRARLRVSLGYLILEDTPGDDEPGDEAQEVYP